MTPPPDSLAAVAIELARLLEPLKTELVPPRTRGLFAQLGIPLTDAQANALGPPIGTIVTRTEDLVGRVPAIVAAVVGEQWGDLVDEGLQATIAVVDAIVAIDALEGAAQGLALPDADKLAQRLFDFLLARYLDQARGLNDALEFVGLLEREDFNVGSADPANPPYTIHTFHFDAIGAWLSDPAAQAEALYGWGPSFDGTKLFPLLERLLAFSGLPVFYDDTATPRRLDAVVVELVPTTTGVPGVALRLKDQFTPPTITIPLGPDASLEIDLQASTPTGTALTLRTDGSVTFTPPNPTSFAGTLGARLILRREAPPEPFLVFGVAGSSRLEFRSLTLGVVATVQADAGSASGTADISGMLEGGKVVIDGSQGDGFITKILPGTRIEADFSFLMGVSTERGFYFGGSSALEVRLPTHIELGPISIEAITLGAGLDGGRIPMSVGADIRAMLGPVAAVVQNMGVLATLSFPPGNTGNLGPAQLDVGFKWPTGVGLRIDAGPVTGGGFLSIDTVKGEYIGALELSFKGVFSLKAIGIINTKMPDGSKGFALLILVTAEFSPIQLGYGFTLLGVGGLLGLNRSLDSEALRLGVRTGAVSSVLFPPDVIGNITRIVSDLKAFFPIVQGHFVVAPMGKLGWGTPTLISLELGIILDIPAPQLTIIGVLRLILPDPDAPVLKLQVNFAGGIDLERGLIWFDASIFDSSLLVFALTGDMAVRIGWGERKILVLSVGGFHPAFDEVPSDLTGMRRLGIALLSGNNPRLFAQTYFAVTSNTIQAGMRVELYVGAGSFNVYGYLGFDVLVHFPFHIVASMQAGLALRRGEDVIAGIEASCELSGPGPWRARGNARFKVLFFSISFPFDETWGEDLPDRPLEPADVLALVVAAVRDVRNWRAELPPNATQTVSLRTVAPTPGVVLLHPFGTLVVSQKVAPLDLPIDRFGERTPVGDRTFTMRRVGGDATEEREEFAVAQFVTMSDSEKLARESFSQLRSGLRLSSDAAATGSAVAMDVTYEMSYLREQVATPAGKVGLPKAIFDRLRGAGAIARNPLSAGARRGGGNGPALVEVDGGEYQVVGVDDLAPVAPAVRTQAEALALRDALVRADPARAGALQVVATSELSMEGVA